MQSDQNKFFLLLQESRYVNNQPSKVKHFFKDIFARLLESGKHFCVFVCMSVSFSVCLYVYECVSVCERERSRQRERICVCL